MQIGKMVFCVFFLLSGGTGMAGEPGLEYYSYAAPNIKKGRLPYTVSQKYRISQEEAELRDSYVVVARDKNERIATIKQISKSTCSMLYHEYKENGELLLSKSNDCQMGDIDLVRENESEYKTSLYTDYQFLKNVKSEERISEETARKADEYYAVKRDDKARVISVARIHKSRCMYQYSYEYKENGDISSFANFRCGLDNIQDVGLEYYRSDYMDYRFLTIPKHGVKITPEQAKGHLRYSIIKRNDAARTLVIVKVATCNFDYSYEYNEKGDLISSKSGPCALPNVKKD